MARKRSIGSLKAELLKKSQEAVLAAIKVFNDPLVQFKSETYIVLMVIAWTYLLHAYYRGRGVDYRYFDQRTVRKRYHRTRHGAYKYWELERCLNDPKSPIDKSSANNLRFLIGLRHEIEHQMTRALDSSLSGRYQACALNFNRYIKSLFGKKYGLDEQLTYSIQFSELSEEQITGPKPEAEIPPRVRAFIAQFDSNLTDEEFNDPRFAYRLIFTRKLVNHKGQADRVIEFIDPKSALGKEIEKHFVVTRETEKPKFRPKKVVEAVRAAGFRKFKMFPHHVDFWRAEQAKDPSKGYGTDVGGDWYWYQGWIDRCIQLCDEAGDTYR
jgi:hypothetical protein